MNLQTVLSDNKNHRMPLVQSGSQPNNLIAAEIRPATAFAGLLLFLGDWEQAHTVAQDIATPEGSYWHAIIHRQEPDPGNAAYWFRQVGNHAIFPKLHQAAATLLLPCQIKVLAAWDPGFFIDLCETARLQPGGALETAAIEVQHTEWLLLLEYCLAQK